MSSIRQFLGKAALQNGWPLTGVFLVAALAGNAHDSTDGTNLSEASSAHNQPISEEQRRGFNEALDSVFPMTPQMIRDYRGAFSDNEEATFDTPYPEAVDDAALITLEPGEEPTEISVAPGIASVVGFVDATGTPWPIRQYVLGNGEAFQVAQLGELSSTIAISPMVRVGWTNLVIALAGEESPVVIKVKIDKQRAHFRRSIQVLKLGPASESGSTEPRQLPSAGDSQMIAALTGVGMGSGATPIPVNGVDGQAWTHNGQLYVRSRHTLLSPPWTSSLAGPGGIRAYRLGIRSTLLFSVDGRIVRATVELP